MDKIQFRNLCAKQLRKTSMDIDFRDLPYTSTYWQGKISALWDVAHEFGDESTANQIKRCWKYIIH